MTDQAVTCKVSHRRLQIEFMMTVVYAFNTKEERRSLWNYIENMNRNLGGPWIIMGDFNAVLHTDDRVGGNPVSLAEVIEFQKCIDQCDLMEMPTSGSRYTWSDRHGNDRIFSKIDWAFINTAWLNLIPTYRATYLEEGISDHCPMKLSMGDSSRRTKDTFKFCNVWASHPNFIDIVKGVWMNEIDGCRMFQVVRKLKMLKNELKRLKKRHFSNLIEEADADRLALVTAQAELHKNPLDAGLQIEEKQRYFFSVIKYRRMQEAIIQLKDKNGVNQTEQEDIAEIFQLQLLRPYTGEEVKKAIFSINDTKSARPDGYGSGFYKAAWTIIGGDVTKAVLEFFENGELLTQINSTSIALIPKVKNPVQIDLKKAYDMVRWEFLEEVLRGYGFPMPFIQLIMVCVRTTKFTVKVNGAGYRYFKGRRGLRQGDPMSPLLFVLVMEYLTRDDLMLFCKGNSQSINRMLEVLNHFSAASGLVANMEKSNIYLARMDEESKQAIVKATGFSVGTLPMRYLGLPLTSKKWSKVECHQLLDKITTNIQTGYAKLLSYAGRLQVINSVLFAVYNFWGAVFILPQSVIKAIDRKCREYLWGSVEGHRKMALGNAYRLTRNGQYIVTRSYNAMLGYLPRYREMKLIWNRILLPRHRFALWLAYQQKLQTKGRLMQLNIPITDTAECCLCDQGILETQQHLFGDCSWFKDMKEALMNWARIKLPNKAIPELLRWISRRHWKHIKKEAATALIGAMVYQTWQARNWRIFRQIALKMEFCVGQIKKEIAYRVSMYAESKRASQCSLMIQRLCA
ncbi:PREDICTED: uncharacterized protein LOC109244316 [Nicotiana attenuata]|uniref:uncharacterized protein LOC109244316 n=1 Tax=Nicotiana attenuata TaxID=49451 RepID=UPI000904A583|nr:PREDICTED: uncharacterized protein LOC109244316 [Nicotiana attenuata]